MSETMNCTISDDAKEFIFGSGQLIEAARAIERDIRRISEATRELTSAVYELDGNAAAVHNQRAELARLNAMRAEDAETIRQLRRELEEVRHGDE